jgi:hypothetical protein
MELLRITGDPEAKSVKLAVSSSCVTRIISAGTAPGFTG